MKNIIDGWYYVLIKDPEIEALAKEKAKHCKGCKHAVTKKILKFVNKKNLEVEDRVCDLCDCPLIAKLRSPNEKCPINLW